MAKGFSAGKKDGNTLQSAGGSAYVWAGQDSGSRQIHRHSQQLVPQDGGEVVGQDLLLLLGAVVFQGQDDRVGGHLSPKKEKQNTTQHNFKKSAVVDT